MIRRWTVRADHEILTVDGEIVQAVSREGLVNAMVDGATMLDIAGGVVTVVVGRAPTGVPGEMVVTEAVVEWKDRTDAKEQAERPQSLTPAQPRTPMDVVAQLSEEQRNALLAAALTPYVPPPADVPVEPGARGAVAAPTPGPVGDGLDELEEEEDVSSIPESER